MPSKGRKQPANRPPTITADVITEVREYLTGGANLREAAMLAGRGQRTIVHWRERGRIEADRIEEGGKAKPTEALYLQFWQETQKARTRRKIKAIAVIQDSMNSQDLRVRLQAAMFYLERAHPDEWAKRDRDPAAEPPSDDELAASEEKARRDALAALDELAERRDRKTG